MKTFTIKMEHNGKIFVTRESGYTIREAQMKAQARWAKLAEVVR